MVKCSGVVLLKKGDIGEQQDLDTDEEYHFLLVRVDLDKLPFEYLPSHVFVHKDGLMGVGMQVTSKICGQNQGEIYLFLYYSA